MEASADDLEDFRREWHREVQSRLGQHSAHAARPASASPPTSVPFVSAVQRPEPGRRPPKDLASAIDVYGAAVEAERQGRLGEATRLYRLAFRADDNIERKFHALTLVDDSKEVADRRPEADLSFAFARTVQVAADYDGTRTTSTSQLTDKLLGSIAEIPFCRQNGPGGEEVPAEPQLAYHAQDAGRPCHFDRLPVEVVLAVLRHLTLPVREAFFPRIAALETGFARLSRRGRLDSLEQTLWRSICERVYRCPQVPSELSFAALGRKYDLDYRRMWLEQARLRTDGCFIAVQRYIRRGSAETAFVDPSWVVTFHRFLRFYADGRVLSLQSSEEPATIVRQLQPGLRISGLLEGRWTLVDGVLACHLENLALAPHLRRHTFELHARLKSTTRGRMNKLDIIRLATRRIGGEQEVEDLPLSADHRRPFYFSPCTSYEPS